jgi:hypothetical protein
MQKSSIGYCLLIRREWIRINEFDIILCLDENNTINFDGKWRVGLI